MATQPFVYVPGLADLRRDLKAVEPAALKEIRVGLKGAAEIVRKGAHPPRRSGDLAASLRATTQGSRAVIRSRLPYANVRHWGGTTGRGHSATTPGATRVKAAPFLSESAEQHGDEAVEQLYRNLDAVFRRHGWR